MEIEKKTQQRVECIGMKIISIFLFIKSRRHVDEIRMSISFFFIDGNI
jgi:hypothetical protein